MWIDRCMWGWCLKVGNIGQVNYAASKAGVEGLTKTAAKELSRWEESVKHIRTKNQFLKKNWEIFFWFLLPSRFGIRCNCVLPGFISTPMTDKVPEKVIDKVELNTFGKHYYVPGLKQMVTIGDAKDHLNIYLIKTPEKLLWQNTQLYHKSASFSSLGSLLCCFHISDEVTCASGKNGWTCRSLSLSLPVIFTIVLFFSLIHLYLLTYLLPIWSLLNGFILY